MTGVFLRRGRIGHRPRGEAREDGGRGQGDASTSQGRPGGGRKDPLGCRDCRGSLALPAPGFKTSGLYTMEDPFSYCKPLVCGFWYKSLRELKPDVQQPFLGCVSLGTQLPASELQFPELGITTSTPGRRKDCMSHTRWRGQWCSAHAGVLPLDLPELVGDEQTSYCVADPVLSIQGPDGADHTPSSLMGPSRGLRPGTGHSDDRGGGSFLCNEKRVLYNWASQDSSFAARSSLDLQASGLSRSQLGNKCFAWLDLGVADLSRPCEWAMKLAGGLLGGLRASLWFSVVL